MASNLNSIMLIQYTRDFAAPVAAGEVIGTMTYFPQYGDPVLYNLTASRSVALILAGLIAGILILRKRRRGRRMKTPKPSRRYVK